MQGEEGGKMINPVQIYTLTDPRNGEVRYVGATQDLKKRLSQHMCQRGHHDRRNWIASLKSDGLKPIIETLEESDLENWRECERYWIEMLMFYGCRLTNYSYGTAKGYHSKETIERVRAANIGRVPSPETRAKMSSSARAAKLGYKYSSEAKSKMSKSARGRYAAAKPRLSAVLVPASKKHGSGSHLSRLTESDVLEIRALDLTMPGVDIAKRFGISATHVSSIVKRRSWRHI